MSINNIKPTGDDQDWKREMENELKAAIDAIKVLQQQQISNSERINK